MTRYVLALAAFACALVAPRPTAAEWRPPDLHATTATLDAVLKANVAATGAAEPRYAQRRETWTYRNGERNLPVHVTVRDDDFRGTVTVGYAEYSGGRSSGTRWRADANGVTHATWSESQGDAIDRLPQSVFPFAKADCTLAGESTRFGAPAWVILNRPPRDKPHWFYVDEASGLIEHEITREGKRAILTAFSDFRVVGGVRRPFRWNVTDGDGANTLDVTVDGVVPDTLTERDVAIPQSQRLFMPATPVASGIVKLPATFHGNQIDVAVKIGERSVPFVFDTGTASITLDRSLAEHVSSGVVLEHATVPAMSVGQLALSNVSTLVIPCFCQGILGYDFFLGHIVHIDFANRKLEVMTPEAAAPVFADARNTVIDASVDEGLPLVHGAFGSATGDRFALDTGSQQLLVLEPFVSRYAHQIQTDWLPARFAGSRKANEQIEFLEGPITVSAREASSFQLGRALFKDVTVGVEQPTTAASSINIPMDGIVGTDELSRFEWWFDYDGGRIAVRRNSR
jgi:hypothetical protein